MKYVFSKFIFFCCCMTLASNLVGQTASETAGCAPLSVTFTAPSDATSFFWDFKDGASADVSNPTNTFVEPGTYEVAFSTAQGGAVVGTITVNVYDKPTLTIAQDPEIGCTPASITLTNTTEIPAGIDLMSTTWTFPDGTGAVGISTDKDYALAGNFSVTMGITTNSVNCNSSTDFTDFIKVVQSPSPAFSISPNATACQGPHTVTLGNETQGSDLTYLWDLGNGNLSTEENPPNQTYTEGDYEISLTATNSDGCSKTITKKVSVGLPIAAFEVPDTVCVGAAITLENLSSAGTYAWSISGPANFVSGATSPAYNFPVGGTYQIRLDVSADGGNCRKDTTITVFAQALDATFTADPIFACSEPMTVTFTPNNPLEGATYSWEFGDDSTSMDTNPVHDYNVDNESPYHPNGEFDFMPKLTMSTAAGCMAEFETELTLDIPLARFMPDTISGCAPLTVELSDSSQSNQPITNWEWIYGDGNTQDFGTGDPHSYTFDTPGEYDVQLVITNNLGCPDTSFMIRVEVGERIDPSFSVDKLDACIGDPIQFTDVTNNPNIDEWHYYTDNDRSSHCYDEANPMIPFETETGTFDVTLVVGYNGCLDSVTQTNLVNVRGPVAHIETMQACETPNTVMFTSASQGATTLSWDFGDGETGTEMEEAHDYASTGDYTVTLTAENTSTGCAASTATATIFIRNIKAEGPVDMEQCKNQPLMLDSGASEDVDTACFRGYTWFFNHPSVRPVTTMMPTVDDISYPDTGMYSVDLVVEDINGCTDTARYPVVVHEALISFDVDKTEICSPQSIQISNINATTTSESIESYMWDFGDGIGMSEEANPGSYTYSIDPGEDQITISVSIEDDAGCPGNSEKVIDFYRPTSQLIASDLTICSGESVSVRATPFIRNGENRPLSYDWSFGNNQDANTESVETIYEEGGIYTIELEYTEIATGCKGIARATANVQDFPEAAFTSDVDGQTELCAPSQVTFMDNSTSLVPLSQSWDFGNGGAGVGASVVASFNPGTYTVRLIVQTSNGCDDETSREFAFDQGPEAVIQLSGTNFCIGDEVTATITDTARVRGFSWEFEGNTFGEGEESVTFTVNDIPPSGSAPIKLNLDGIGECNSAIQELISVNGVVPTFTADPSGCDLDVTFINGLAGNIRSQWDFGDGATSTENNTLHTYGEAGTYNVTLTVEDIGSGCVGTITQSVQVGSITADGGFTANQVRCLDYRFVVDPSFSGTFPIFTFDYGDGTAGSSTTHSYNEEGTYTVTLVGESSDGCQSELITQTITAQLSNVTGGEAPQYVPNAFTPDQMSGVDRGPNDKFRVTPSPLNTSTNACRKIESVLGYKIYNRWGKLVYENSSPYQFPDTIDPMDDSQPGWDGTDSGNGFNYPADVYVYYIEVAFSNGDTEVLKGDVTLIR